MKQIALLLCILLIASCATSPVSIGEAKPVPSERVFGFNGTPTSTDGQIVLVRDSGMLGSGCRADIYIDDKEAALVSTSEKLSLTIPAGEHLLSSQPSNRGMCGLGGAKDKLRRTVSIDVKPGHTQTFRIAIMGDGGATVMPTSL